MTRRSLPDRLAVGRPGYRDRVIVIPEGVQYDHLILRPIFSAMFRHLGKRNAKIDIHSPEVRGFDAVRRIDYILTTIADFPTADLFILCVDRDGDPHRREALNDLESKISKVLPAPRLFLAEHAWQEVEVWALAGIDWRLKPEAGPGTRSVMSGTRRRRFSEPIARERNLFNLPGQGRKELGIEAAQATTPGSTKTARRFRDLARADSAVGSRPLLRGNPTPRDVAGSRRLPRQCRRNRPARRT